jgi:hypothetical protein
MRLAPIFFAVLLLTVGCGDRATGQSSSNFGIENPREFAEAVSRRVASEGVEPIRQVIGQFGSGDVTPDPSGLEGGLVMFDRAINGDEARVWNRIEDVSLADQYRAIYYLHVFNDRTYLFTRYEFARTGPRTWNLIGVTFGSNWQQVALIATPGFRSQQ